MTKLKEKNTTVFSNLIHQICRPVNAPFESLPECNSIQEPAVSRSTYSYCNSPGQSVVIIIGLR